MKIETKVTTTKQFIFTETEARVIHDIFSQLSKTDLSNLLSNSCTKLVFKDGIDAAHEQVCDVFFALNDEFNKK
jgi:hypothetical protein